MTTPCSFINEQVGFLYTCSTVGNYTRIQTPFLYPDGDIIDIFFQGESNVGTLTDLGETQRWLRMQTVSQRQTQKQKQLIADICLTHNIELYKGMLMARVKKPEDFTDALTRLGQCMIRVSDLWFTFRYKTGDSINEDVEDLLYERKIKFSRSPKILGRSSTVWRPDFQIRGKEQSSLVRVMSTGSRAVAHNMALYSTSMWHDLNILKVGKEAMKFISLFDDTEDVWSQEDIGLVESLSDIAFWSHRDDFLEKVA